MVFGVQFSVFGIGETGLATLIAKIEAKPYLQWYEVFPLFNGVWHWFLIPIALLLARALFRIGWVRIRRKRRRSKLQR